MRLVLYSKDYECHRKNVHGLRLMCASYKIDFEYTNNCERIYHDDYDILVSSNEYVDPDKISPHIKIIFGPHFGVIPDGPIVGKYNHAFEGRVVYNTLSPWVKKLYNEIVPSFITPLVQFPFAVDIDAFNVSDTKKDIDCLLYIKNRRRDIEEVVIQTLNSIGIHYVVIRYGGYNEDVYKELLHRSKFMLTLDAHESQGFALQEAIACNVPLLVLDVKSMHDEYGARGTAHNYASYEGYKMDATSVPYWSDLCGIKIYNIDQIEPAIDIMLSEYANFEPRKFIVEELSATPCMKRILDYFRM